MITANDSEERKRNHSISSPQLTPKKQYQPTQNGDVTNANGDDDEDITY